MKHQKHNPPISLRIGLALVPLLLFASCSPVPHAWRGTPYQPPRPAPGFSITDGAGQEFSLDEQRGVAILLYFGYTYCPDVCPATAAILGQVFETLEPARDDLKFVMISVDPERDSAVDVASYMQKFHPDFVGLRPDRPQLEAIQEAYGIIATKDDPDNPDTTLITHTARIFLIDTEGQLRAHYAFGSTPEDFIVDLSYLLEAK